MCVHCTCMCTISLKLWNLAYYDVRVHNHACCAQTWLYVKQLPLVYQLHCKNSIHNIWRWSYMDHALSETSVRLSDSRIYKKKIGIGKITISHGHLLQHLKNERITLTHHRLPQVHAHDYVRTCHGMFTKLASANWDFTTKPIAGVYNWCFLAFQISCGYKFLKSQEGKQEEVV